MEWQGLPKERDCCYGLGGVVNEIISTTIDLLGVCRYPPIVVKANPNVFLILLDVLAQTEVFNLGKLLEFLGFSLNGLVALVEIC